MDLHPLHIEQYKMLREEIMQDVREMYRTELAGAVAITSVYTWLLLHKRTLPSRAVWFIPPAVIAMCALRVLDLQMRIKRIAAYLRRIENAAFGKQSPLSGWENHKRGDQRFESISQYVAAAAWVSGLALSVFASLFLSR